MDHLTNYKKQATQTITRLINPINNIEINDTDNMAEALASEFIVDNSTQLSKRRNRYLQDTISDYCSQKQDEDQDTFNTVVSPEEVSTAISLISNSDSTFDLNIPVRCLKNLSSTFSTQLAPLFTTMLTTFCIPIEMKAYTHYIKVKEHSQIQIIIDRSQD